MDNEQFYHVYICLEVILLYCVLQLKALGFDHMDGLDPSPEMLEVAKADNLYENYIVAYVNDKQLNIPSGITRLPIDLQKFRPVIHAYPLFCQQPGR